MAPSQEDFLLDTTTPWDLQRVRLHAHNELDQQRQSSFGALIKTTIG